MKKATDSIHLFTHSGIYVDSFGLLHFEGGLYALSNKYTARKYPRFIFVSRLIRFSFDYPQIVTIL